MVNHGRSNGCMTCKQRRVKCDQARPKCQACQRLGLHCGGYKTKYAALKFRDQTHKFFTNNRDKHRGTVSIIRSPTEPDTAVPFFFQHYAGIGRSMGSARGFFEVLIPIYRSQPQHSALSLAVSAVASKVLGLWRHDTRNFRSESYTQAVKCLRRTIADRSEWGKPETVLAVLALQLYENITAIYGLRTATRVHHDGAMSLLPFVGSHSHNITGAGVYPRRFILHTEISSAMRQERPLQSAAYSWASGYGLNLIPVPENPSSALDAIGASVAELQASYLQLTQYDTLLSQRDVVLAECTAEAKRIDEQLLAWTQSVPDHWYPLRLASGRDIDPSIRAYQSVCEVYPYCQIANIWNLWRIQRLLLVKISLSSASTNSREQLEYRHTLQELVDSICYSVPFYLGNRTKPSSIPDFTDPAIVFPSDYLTPADKSSNTQSNIPHSLDEHKRHLIAQGPWHLMSPLSRLLTLFSEYRGQQMATFLRPGQYEWICEQFLRVTTLLHIPQMEMETGGERNYTPLASSPANGCVNSRVEDLAKKVRKGAIFMSGP